MAAELEKADETSADLEMTNGGIDEATAHLLKERLAIINELIHESQAVDEWLLEIQSLCAQLKEFDISE